MAQHYSTSVEFDIGESGENPIATLILDIDFTYTPGQPDKFWPWPGEPGYPAEVDIVRATFFNLIKTIRQPIPEAANAWLFSLLNKESLRQHMLDAVEDARAEYD